MHRLLFYHFHGDMITARFYVAGTKVL